MASEIIRGLTVKGQDIIEAVKTIASEVVVKPDYINGEDVFVVGQTSEYPYDHLIVAVNGKAEINPEKEYQKIVVKEHNWGGEMMAVSYSQKVVIDSVKGFAKLLKAELSKKAIRVKPVKRPISFTFEGIEYECDQSAYEINRIVLPDGRVLAARSWFESLPPQPDALFVMNYPIATCV